MTAELAAGLAAIELRVRRVLAARRADDPNPDDPYRGLYLTPAAIDAILDDPVRIPSPDPPSEPLLPAFAATFGLSALEVEILLIALMPDLDARFERLYGYLNDDVTRRRPTLGLALELCRLPPFSTAARARFAATEPLRANGLLTITDEDRPLLSRTLEVSDRVTAHLLGDPTPDPVLHGIATIVAATPSGGERSGHTPGDPALHPTAASAGPARLAEEQPGDPKPDPSRGEVASAVPGDPVPHAAAGMPVAQVVQVARAIRAGVRLFHLRQAAGTSSVDLAVAALAETERAAVVLDLSALTETDNPALVLSAALREARLRSAGLIAGPIDAVADRRQLLRALTTAPGIPILLHGKGAWHPDWPGTPPLRLTTEPATTPWPGGWLKAVQDTGFPLSEPDESTVDEALRPYTLTSSQLTESARAAAGLALLDGGTLTVGHLRAGVRAQNGAGLARLARRIEPAVGWADLVLPDEPLERLRELVLRARHRDRVLGSWRMRPGGGRGTGVLGLFAGESGTGKTMSAEVVAAELGLDLYVVDLATVVDKYIGETEKNLDRIFTEASGVNGLLLFDEADALFGKRTEVKDSHDRNANLESAFLLQRMESFDGIAVLTTNLRANLDDAFTRRLDVIADFPVPDADQRLALWDRCLGPSLPRSSDVDLAFCAKSFELAGGSIRACAVTAAYLAAEAARPVAMTDLISAIRREYRKLGRLLLESEFGAWLTEG